MTYRTEVEDYVASKHWNFKTGGGQIILEVCPFCECDGFHFRIGAENGGYQCKKCNESGYLPQLKRKMGDLIRPERAFPKEKKSVAAQLVDKLRAQYQASTEARAYMAARGLADEWLCGHFRIGYDAEKKAIAIPYTESGKYTGVKYRSIEKKAFAAEKDCSLGLLNVECVDVTQPVIVTEGEFDCMSAWLMGFQNVVSLPNGASSFKTAGEFLYDAKEVIIATDNDEQGDIAAAGIAKLLGAYRCMRLKFIHKDWNDALLKNMTAAQITDVIKALQPMIGGGIISFGEIVKKLLGRDHAAGADCFSVKTEWDIFDRLFGGGFRENEMTILTADTGVGKTTWALNVVHRLSAKDVSCLVISAEESNFAIAAKLITIQSGRCYETIRNAYASEKYQTITPHEINNAINFFTESNLVFWNGRREIGLLNVVDLMRYCVAKFDTKFFLLDHLHQFIGSERPEFERQNIEAFMRGMNEIVKELPIHAMVICHPSKEIGEKNKHPHMNTLKGSAAIKQYAWNVMSLRRTHDGAELQIQKKRSPLAREGVCGFVFDEETLRYEIA